MGSTSSIEWTDATWSPFAGCTPISPGCKNCYATRLAVRLQANGVPGFDGVARSTPQGPKWTGKVNVRPNFMDPIRWKKARRIFVNSQSDTFHEGLPDGILDEVFGVMLASCFLENTAPHVFQVLTKRAARMHRYLSAPPGELLLRWAKAVDPIVHVGDGDTWFSELVEGHCSRVWRADRTADPAYPNKPMGYTADLFPLPNVWLGVSVEDQERAEERIPSSLAAPAAVKFLSCEPLLGPVNLARVPLTHDAYARVAGVRGALPDPSEPDDYVWGLKKFGGINWVIVGGESGPGARPMSLRWARSLVEQTRAAGVKTFVKQLGALPCSPSCATIECNHPDCDPGWLKLRDPKGGDPSEWPPELRVQEFPEVPSCAS